MLKHTCLLYGIGIVHNCVLVSCLPMCLDFMVNGVAQHMAIFVFFCAMIWCRSQNLLTYTICVNMIKASSANKMFLYKNTSAFEVSKSKLQFSEVWAPHTRWLG